MSGKVPWLSLLRSVVNKSPLKSNFVIGFIMILLEKMVEMDFECPCKPYWNIASGICYFTIPALITLVIMVMAQSCICSCSRCRCSCNCCLKCCSKCCSKCCCKQHLSSIMAAALWVIVLFLDGRYYECIQTNWDGDYVKKDQDPPHNWCKPFDEKDSTVWRHQSQFYIAQSQIIGMGLLVFDMVLAVCVFCLTPQDTLSKNKEEGGQKLVTIKCNSLVIEGRSLLVKAEGCEEDREEIKMAEGLM